MSSNSSIYCFKCDRTLNQDGECYGCYNIPEECNCLGED